MAITSTELESYSGDDFIRLLTFTDTTGIAVNISNYTLYVTIKYKYTDNDMPTGITEAVYQKNLTTTDFTDPTHGKTVVTIAHADTEKLEGVYVIDIKYKEDNGTVGTALNGRINFFKDISTRASL